MSKHTDRPQEGDGAEMISVTDSTAAAGGPERRGPCTRDYETDGRRTKRHVRDDSRWDIYRTYHAPGQSHE